MNNVIQIIKTELKKHSYPLADHHTDEIANAIYKQLLEYMDENVMESLIHEFKHTFIDLVDVIIPVVEEYETQIENLLELKIGNIVKRAI